MDEINKNLQFLIPSSEIIKKTYLKQCSEDVSRFLSLESKFDWNIITEVDLSFLNIVHICNFTLVTNLKYLRLAQNKIQTIENLDQLTKLEKLDLSHNNILKIENLDNLTALTFISLSGNKISKLENLDTISQLQTLLINDNKITNIDELFYLTRFKYLKVLDIMNNPATEYFTPADFEAKTVKFPNLQYINSKRIPKSMILLPENELEYNRHNLSQAPDERQDILTDANGEQFMYNVIYKDDNAWKILSKLNKNVLKSFVEYEKQIKENAIALNIIRLKKIDGQEEKSLKFKMAYYTFEREWTNKNRKLIREHDEITQMRIKVRKDNENGSVITINNSGNLFSHRSLDLDPIESVTLELEDEMIALTDRLHMNNIYINESLMSMISKYESKLEDELKMFTESVAAIYANIRKSETDYSQILMDNVRATVNNRQKVIPQEITNRFENKYEIIDAASESGEKHLEQIYKHEENLISDTKKWTKKTIDDLKITEKKRFWMVIEEIRKYHDTNTDSSQTLEQELT
ncbi:Leucine-rich repeat,Leucine-rich repeat domain, L domain-like [Cinara cedri]|uniref:Dynein axonemal assembly factor 1 homolog n=1 Tax=Cinara cedri TaxID=506608 RepID=A0A5E4NH63_9HEMI|nr:Leucine-rich repeat,Leucine-rich repeat domain, L domain-like [Cinara cedri]